MKKTGGIKWLLLAPQFVRQFHSKKRQRHQLNRQTKHWNELKKHVAKLQNETADILQQHNVNASEQHI